MKIVGYTRVSTRTQVEEGLGLDIQTQAIKGWAKTNGHRIVAWACDEGVSGAKDLEDRDGLADALALIKDAKAEGVVVYRLDRLARDLIIQESLIAEIRRLGGTLFTTVGGEAAYLADDPDDPSRKLIRQVLGAVAEYDRSMIALRLRTGRRRKAERGGYAFGAPAFGVAARDRELVALADEQVTLDRIAELHRDGASTRAICAALNAEGRGTKRGGPWQPMVVSRIVKRLGRQST